MQNIRKSISFLAIQKMTEEGWNSSSNKVIKVYVRLMFLRIGKN